MKLGLIGVGTMVVGTLVGVSRSYAEQPQPAEEAVRAADQHWARVFGTKDLERSTAVCAADASVLPPNAPAAAGKQAIRQLFAGYFALPDLRMDWHPTKVEVAGSGDLGYTTGVYQMSYKETSGKTVCDHGKYVTVWKKQADGSWKVAFDIFNSDLPPVAASP